jgi:hypothetical protein
LSTHIGAHTSIDISSSVCYCNAAVQRRKHTPCKHPHKPYDSAHLHLDQLQHQQLARTQAT